MSALKIDRVVSSVKKQNSDHLNKMADVEASTQERPSRSTRVNNPYNEHDPSVLPTWHPINVLHRVLYMGCSLYGLHYFQAYQKLMQDPNISHEWFKVGLAATVGESIPVPCKWKTQCLLANRSNGCCENFPLNFFHWTELLLSSHYLHQSIRRNVFWKIEKPSHQLQKFSRNDSHSNDSFGAIFNCLSCIVVASLWGQIRRGYDIGWDVYSQFLLSNANLRTEFGCICLVDIFYSGILLTGGLIHMDCGDCGGNHGTRWLRMQCSFLRQ